MFEEGARLKAERGAENVFDFTLGNPDLDPPPAVLEALRAAAARIGRWRPRLHEQRRLRRTCAPRSRERLARATGLPYTADHVLMTVGSSGAINTVLKAMLDPGRRGDRAGAVLPGVSLLYRESRRPRGRGGNRTRRFSRTCRRIERRITPRTRAIILNSPNNPDRRRLLRRRCCAELEAMLARAARSVRW